jgi:hypothetical protein
LIIALSPAVIESIRVEALKLLLKNECRTIHLNRFCDFGLLFFFGRLFYRLSFTSQVFNLKSGGKMEGDLVKEVLKKLGSFVTEEVVRSAFERYGEIDTDLLTYAIVFDLSAPKMPTVYEASSKAQQKVVDELVDEVDELKELLEKANTRAEEAEISLRSNSSKIDVTALSQNSVQTDESFIVEELEKELEEKYLIK